jgi:hypothetical protein
MVWRRLAQGAKQWVDKGACACGARVSNALLLTRRPTSPSQPFLHPFLTPPVRDPHPPLERLLYSFSTPEDLARWTLYSDAEYGGATTAALAASAEFPVCCFFFV